MSDVSTINGKSIGGYDDYKNNIPEGGSASTFEQTAKIPLAGKYNASDETMETRSVLLSELGGGGGGGSSAPTEITPSWDGMNSLFTVRVPSNNGIFFANLPDKGQVAVEVEVIPPTIASGEIFNFTVVIINEWEVGNDHHMFVNDPYGRIRATDEITQYGNVYGNSTTRFVVLGNGYTMFTTAYSGG